MLTGSSIGTQYGTHGTDALLATIDANGHMSAPASTAPGAPGGTLWPVQYNTSTTVQPTTGMAMLQDSSGNTYIAGSLHSLFTGATTFGPTISNNVNAFLGKFDSSGNVIWMDEFGITNGVDDSSYATSLAFDTSGNIYVGGYRTSSNHAGIMDAGSPHPATQLGTTGSTDCFVVEVSPSGAQGTFNVQLGEGSGTHVQCFGVGVDSSSNVYVVGTTDTTIGGASYVFGSNAGATTYLFTSKISTAPSITWTNEIGNNSNAKTNTGVALLLDSAPNVYVTGTSPDPGGGNPFSATQYGNTWGTTGTVIAKFAGGGGATWIDTLSTGGPCNPTAMALDGSGNLIVVGEANNNYQPTLPAGTVGGGSIFGYVGLLNGSTNLYVSSFTPAGSLNWSDEVGAGNPCAGGEGCSGFVEGQTYGTGVAVDSSGTIFVAGYTNGFVTGAQQYLSHSGAFNGGGFNANDILVSRFTSSGSYLGSSQMGGETYDTEAWAVAPSHVSGYSVFVAGFTTGYLGTTLNGTEGPDDVLLTPVTSSGGMP